MSERLYHVNPDRSVPWNELPSLPIKEELYETVDIMKKLGDAKASLAKLHGRSIEYSYPGNRIEQMNYVKDTLHNKDF